MTYLWITCDPVTFLMLVASMWSMRSMRIMVPQEVARLKKKKWIIKASPQLKTWRCAEWNMSGSHHT